MNPLLKTSLLLTAGTLSTGALTLLAAASGELPVSFSHTLQAVSNGLGVSQYPLPAIEQGVVWQYRMSRAVMAAFSGGGLAICGVVLQALLRNPLAEPYLLGISAGASTGAVLVMLLGFGGSLLSVSGGAFLGALAAFAVIMLLARGLRDGPARIILSGIAATQLFNALTACVVSTSANAEQSRGVMFWLLGSLSGVRWPDVLLSMAVTGPALLLFLSFARTLDTFSFGEEVASTLGTAVTPVRILLLLTAALLTAVLVSIIGAVGFIGLVIPHLTRFFIGPPHLRLLPAAFLAGAHFMIIADLLSRSLIAHQVLPIGVVTALVGAPVFAAILWRQRGAA
ncbi:MULTISPECIES: iron ABC transporter permease [unclassified Erwinia]|uniref:FecCD family ABC transporter permease n=1 Tax=unclassified Erwinia TaxID=2622719 RepID=UPI0006FDB039|nr:MULTISPECIES: iron chelate uptake ABC transporter family permease subunit [unclassified Erwinia]KQN53413.1 ABC transporter permease [Erwinia sp. Leaf53]PLV61934.1 ABC transporter permease [Erwinia sp. B116]